MKNFLLGFLVGNVFSVVLAVILIAAYWYSSSRTQSMPQSVSTAPGSAASVPAPTAASPTPRPEPETPPAVPFPRTARTADNLTLEEAFQAKFDNPEFVAWLKRPGLPSGFQHFPEERTIKAVRSRLAAQVQAPPDAEVVEIPLLRDAGISVDGVLDEGTWSDALARPVGVNGMEATLFMVSDGRSLFLGCDAKDETTEKGYDQFRFYWHLTTDPLIVNERIHVGQAGRTSWRIRDTTFQWPEAALDAPNARPRRLSDWNINESAEATSSLKEHRVYEVRLELAESGLHAGIPFGARVDVETDPVEDANGKFVRRVTLGEWGSQKNPVWFRIGKPSNATARP